MSSANRGRSHRQDRERARLYAARTQHHQSVARRRRRDNVLAGVLGTLLIAGAIVSQAVYFTTGPGAPAPSPAATEPPAPTGDPTLAPTLVPEPSETPAETPAPSP